MGVVVDATDDAALSFYLHHEFIPLLDHPNRLFLAMATIEQAFSRDEDAVVFWTHAVSPETRLA
jgi:hypothetical protein